MRKFILLYILFVSCYVLAPILYQDKGLEVISHAWNPCVVTSGKADVACSTANDEEPINDGTTVWGHDPGGALGHNISATTWRAQSFTIAGSGSATLTQIQGKMAWWTGGAKAYYEIQGNDVGGGDAGVDCPDNSAIADGTTDQVAPSNEALGGDCDECGEDTYPFSSLPTVTKGTKYWLVLKGIATIYSNYAGADAHTSDYVGTTDSGSAWAAASLDTYFQIDGCD